MNKNYKIFKDKENAKILKNFFFKYLLKSSQLSQIKSKGVERIYSKKSYTKKISNLNHNGALLPKIENQDEFFNIFEKFKNVLKKKIKKKYVNSLSNYCKIK